MRRRGSAILPLLLLPACHGGNPTAPPPPTDVNSLALLVFYDENGNGRLEPAELGRIPNVTVAVGARTGRSQVPSGQATVSGLPAGHLTVSVRPDTLPPFYVAPAAAEVEVPSTATIEVPVGLAIGSNVPSRYMAFGDSITVGDGSFDNRGYEPLLEDRLRMYYGTGEVVNEGIDGTRSEQGANRIGSRLNANHPAFTLIHYGTNDWNKCDDVPSCFTEDALRSMVEQVKAAGGKPVLATIIPCNVGYDARTPPSRNEFVAEQDVQIRALAREQGAVLVDLEAAFYRAAGDDLSQLFSDHVHPNDRGYEIMAEEFFRGLTTPAPGLATTADFAPPQPLFAPPAARGPAPPGAPQRPAPRGPRRDER